MIYELRNLNRRNIPTYFYIIPFAKHICHSILHANKDILIDVKVLKYKLMS